MNDSTSIHFNSGGVTHSLRIRPVDEKPGEVTVYEGMVDATTLFWFEARAGIHDEVWELIELAVQSYLDYLIDDHVAVLKWESKVINDG